MQKFRSKKSIKIYDVAGLADMLTKMEFPRNKPNQLNKYEIIYLTGGWFEEYIYNKIKDELNLEDEHITTGLQVVKNDVPNEFDVIFSYKNKIYTIECKTSVNYFKTAKKELQSEILFINAIVCKVNLVCLLCCNCNFKCINLT